MRFLVKAIIFLIIIFIPFIVVILVLHRNHQVEVTPEEKQAVSNVNTTQLTLETTSELANVENVTKMKEEKTTTLPLPKERNFYNLPRPATCKPTPQVVTLGTSNNNTIKFPSSIRIERCTGECSHSLLSCQPVKTETVNFRVAVSEIEEKQRHFKFLRQENVAVERHTQCRCNCIIKESDCNTMEIYEHSKCQCVCKNNKEKIDCEKDESKLWDPALCTCTCKTRECFADLLLRKVNTFVQN